MYIKLSSRSPRLKSEVLSDRLLSMNFYGSWSTRNTTSQTGFRLSEQDAKTPFFTIRLGIFSRSDEHIQGQSLAEFGARELNLQSLFFWSLLQLCSRKSHHRNGNPLFNQHACHSKRLGPPRDYPYFFDLVLMSVSTFFQTAMVLGPLWGSHTLFNLYYCISAPLFMVALVTILTALSFTYLSDERIRYKQTKTNM